ncbi:hypothetical protein [Halopiger goleimassiliensis]|uniref:hypothetical protein n=1 Tax=Halopiger goleimassiliensis TaxID=1293048 RepID=UPI0006777F0A|nr:hypothetical protein [Halopiger goleimassiliensis]
MLDYYDAIIVAIAASLAAGIALGRVTSVGVQTGVVLGSLAATGFVYHALFRNPPLPRTNPRAVAVAIVWHAGLIGLLGAVVLG